jgi:hypothetical protein
MGILISGCLDAASLVRSLGATRRPERALMRAIIPWTGYCHLCASLPAVRGACSWRIT